MFESLDQISQVKKGNFIKETKNLVQKEAMFFVLDQFYKICGPNSMNTK